MGGYPLFFSKIFNLRLLQSPLDESQMDYFLIGFYCIGIDYRKNRYGPRWDNTGITVIMIIFFGFSLWISFPSKPWIVALSSGIWIPVFNLTRSANLGSFWL